MNEKRKNTTLVFLSVISTTIKSMDNLKINKKFKFIQWNLIFVYVLQIIFCEIIL